MAEKGSQSQVFFGNIANINPGNPLKKMIPLMEDHVGGGGGAWGPPLAYGLYVFQSCDLESDNVA